MAPSRPFTRCTRLPKRVIKPLRRRCGPNTCRGFDRSARDYNRIQQDRGVSKDGCGSERRISELRTYRCRIRAAGFVADREVLAVSAYAAALFHNLRALRGGRSDHPRAHPRRAFLCPPAAWQSDHRPGLRCVQSRLAARGRISAGVDNDASRSHAVSGDRERTLSHYSATGPRAAPTRWLPRGQ